MATRAELQAQLNALYKESAALWLKLKAEILATNGQKLAQIITENDLHYVGKKNPPSLWAQLGLPTPGKGMTEAQAVAINNDASKLEFQILAEEKLWHELNPTNSISNWEVLGLMVLAVVGAAAVTYAAGAGAGAAAGSGAATTATTTGTLATATGITAPTLTTVTLAPIGTGAVAAAANAAGASAATALGAAAATAVPAAVGAAATAASTGGSILGKITSALSGSSAVSTSGSITSDILNGINKYLPGLSSFLDPIISIASDTLSGIEKLNSDIVVPLFNTIGKDYNSITGLIGEVHTLAHSGIEGILAIPQAISNTISGLEASAARIAQLTGNINQGIVSNTLVPGITSAVAEPIGQLHDVFKGVFEQQVPGVGQLSIDKLNETEFNLDQIRKAMSDLPNGKEIAWPWGSLLSVIALVAFDFAKLAGVGDTVVEWSKQLGQQANPITPLASSEAIRAWWRGQISPEQAQQELLRQGIDPTRAKLLHDMEQWLPAIGDAIKLYYRQNIGKDEFFAALAKQGLSNADANAMLMAALEPLNPREAIEMNGRLAAGQAGLLPHSLNQPCPTEYKALYTPRMTDPEIGNIDWLRHWKLPDFGTWCTMYFRGVIDKQQLTLAAQAANIPSELVDGLILAEQEPIQLWMVPDMLGAGILTEQEAVDYLAYIGVDPRSSAVMIKLGQSKAKTTSPLTAPDLAKISLGNASAMFEDGIIDKQEYIAILQDHGLALDAATLTADLEETKLEIANRRARALALIEQVLKGELTATQFDTTMVSEGFTLNERNKYNAILSEKLILKQKVLSEGEIKTFVEHGIITMAEAQALLELSGYSQNVAQAFILLYKTLGYTGAGSSLITG